jgi:hypothetical protein
MVEWIVLQFLSYPLVCWILFVVIAFLAAYFGGWIGILIGCCAISFAVLLLDIDYATTHAYMDMDIVFTMGVMFRAFFINGVLLSVSAAGLLVRKWRKSRRVPDSRADEAARESLTRVQETRIGRLKEGRMGKRIIGKRVRVQLGGQPPEDDDAIVGDDVSVYVPSEDLGKYDSITGERVEISIRGDLDQLVQDMMATVQNLHFQERDEIVAICREILEEKDQKSKVGKVATLISVGAGIAEIAQFVIQLRAFVPGA